jgi:uncharacterized protein YidB (DUF937 family)
MGMFDGLLGSVLGGIQSGSGTQAQSPIMQMALQYLQQNGGVSGVIDKLRQAGYGAQADSWVRTGENLPISPDALRQALGSGQLGDLASKLGISHGEAAGSLASVLPQIIDQLTPQGQIPNNHNDLVSEALAIVQRCGSA